jgi:hypothetical protein
MIQGDPMNRATVLVCPEWMSIGLLLASLLLSATSTFAQTEGAVAQWSFEESTKGQVHDSIVGVEDELKGFYKRVKGVSGNALRFDGYTTSIWRKPENVPIITASLSVEAWVAVNTYPWNWVPIVDHRMGEEAGYFVGIDSFGHVGIQARVNDKWQVLASKAQIALKKWTHIAASFDRDSGFKIYLNGQPAGELSAKGAIEPARYQSLIIGRTREPILPSEWLHPKHAVMYSFDGIVDELKIFSRSLSAHDIESDFAQIRAPVEDPLRFAVLPSGPPGPGRFGAYYATLKYEEMWEAPRRVGPQSDVVVRFDELPIRFVFWQGTNYIPAWVTENGKWYTDEFMETGDNCPPGQDCEPMSDQQVRYARVRILESNGARAVVHFRYNLCDVVSVQGANPDPLTGWTDWGDEYYTIYPDGVAVRKQVLRATNTDNFYEFQETMIINSPGTRPEDNINTDALTFVNMRGETATYSWEQPPAKIERPDRPNIQVVNLKSNWKPFQIVSDVRPKVSTYTGEKTYSMFEWWNHWPVAQIASSGVSAVAPDKPSHSSLSHIEGEPTAKTETSMTKIMLHGLTNQSSTALVTLAKSWLHAPPLEVLHGEFLSEGYDREQRAFVISSKSGNAENGLELVIHASVDSPLLNPAFVVKNWGDREPRLKIDGKLVRWGPEFRYGRVNTLEGTDLLVWAKLQSTHSTTFALVSLDGK